MRFDMAALAPKDRYKLMCSSITPRPIAWVTSQSKDGVRNAAPFSFFNMMASDPPLIVLGLTWCLNLGAPAAARGAR